MLILGNNPASNVQNDRIGGLRSAMREGAQAETLWIERLEQVHGKGCSLGLAGKVAEGVTAFAAVSDLQALRALTELQRAGIHVPEQASVTGFDDLIWSPVVTPALTTIRMDMARIATLAVEALVQAIGAGEAEFPSHGRPVAATISKVPMQLVVRQSTATPPSNVQPAPNVKPPSEGEPQS